MTRREWFFIINQGVGRLSSQKGTILLIPLLGLMAIFAFFSLSNLSTSSIEVALSGNYRAKTSSFYAADAGIEHTRRLIVNTPQAVLNLNPGGKVIDAGGAVAQPISLGGGSSYRVFLQSKDGYRLTFRSICILPQVGQQGFMTFISFYLGPFL